MVKEAVTQPGNDLFTQTPMAESIMEALAPPCTHLQKVQMLTSNYESSIVLQGWYLTPIPLT